jgi:hypothetical protein
MFKNYVIKNPGHVKAEQFVRGMESGWRAYFNNASPVYFESSDENFVNRIKDSTGMILESIHPLYKIDGEILEMNFGDYILETGEILSKEDFENLYKPDSEEIPSEEEFNNLLNNNR